ncbi:hypothetical protein M758_3G241400 [Ceratodon purpureus]|nr:hypothetical protein M758_3G241400 [Ceratodon purpureus]
MIDLPSPPPPHLSPPRNPRRVLSREGRIHHLHNQTPNCISFTASFLHIMCLVSSAYIRIRVSPPKCVFSFSFLSRELHVIRRRSSSSMMCSMMRAAAFKSCICHCNGTVLAGPIPAPAMCVPPGPLQLRDAFSVLGGTVLGYISTTGVGWRVAGEEGGVCDCMLFCGRGGASGGLGVYLRGQVLNLVRNPGRP